MNRKSFVLAVLPVFAFLLLHRTSSLVNNTATTASGQEKIGQSHPSDKPKRKISLVVRLRGEMANHLSLLAFGKGVQLWIQEHHPHITVELVGERQSGTKWKSAVGALRQCFPNLRTLDFQGGKWNPDFIQRRDQLKAWIGEEKFREHIILDGGDTDCGTVELFCLNDRLSFLLELLDQDVPGHVLSNMTLEEQRQNSYSLPFLITNQLASFDVIVDQYYDAIKEWFEFDWEACCSAFEPSQEEVAFHLRNFQAEMKHHAEKGYEEIAPKQLANELLAHIPNGTQVAIASRGSDFVQNYPKALTDRGLVPRRTPESHTGVEDFCFLLKVQRELFGTMRSTYTRWAALLGRAKRVHLYSMDSEWTRQAHGNGDDLPGVLHYQWKHPELKSRIQYRVFQRDDNGDK